MKPDPLDWLADQMSRPEEPLLGQFVNPISRPGIERLRATMRPELPPGTIDRIALDAMHEIAKVAGIRRVQAELPRRSQIQIIVEKAIRRAMEERA